jgi:Domain of unknown function (DUF4266)
VIRGRISVYPIALVALLQGSCATVPVYERSRLAHPTMAPDDGSTLSRDHVYVVHEGAVGGSLQTTSGCGCN